MLSPYTLYEALGHDRFRDVYKLYLIQMIEDQNSGGGIMTDKEYSDIESVMDQIEQAYKMK